MYPRAIKMTLKPRHILVSLYHFLLLLLCLTLVEKKKKKKAGYPLVTTLLCVSRKDFFAANWTSVMDSCYQKFNKVHIQIYIHKYSYETKISTFFKKNKNKKPSKTNIPAWLHWVVYQG